MKYLKVKNIYSRKSDFSLNVSLKIVDCSAIMRSLLTRIPQRKFYNGNMAFSEINIISKLIKVKTK